MKRKNLLKIAVLPIVLFTAVAFTNLPQKDKGQDKGKSQEEKSDKGKGQGSKEDKGHSQSDNNDHKEKGNHQEVNKSDKGNKHHGQGNAGKMDHKKNSGHEAKNYGNDKSKKLNGKRDGDIDWNLNDFANRKHPKDQKKVSICHKPTDGDSNNGVTINVSENALKAHMNHGDKMGNCTIDYSDRWSSNYVKSRESVYNTYEQTWESMSYSEALVRLAADKIFGIKSNLDRNRATLSAGEIQRREALIYELQSNSNALDTQVGVTRQRLDSDVNIIIKL